MTAEVWTRMAHMAANSCTYIECDVFNENLFLEEREETKCR